MKTPLLIERGTNPSILKKDGDPSGFEQAGYSAEEIEQVMHIAALAAEEVQRAAPEALLKTMTHPIGIYADVENAAKNSARVMASYLPQLNENIEFEFETSGKKLTGLRSMRIKIHAKTAIILRKKAEVFLENIDIDESTAILGHELIHSIVSPALEHSEPSNEAITCRLEQEIFGMRSNGAKLLNLFDREHIRATSGLRCPEDFAHLENTPASKLMLYCAAYTDLVDVPAQSLWNACADARASAMHAGYFGTHDQLMSALDKHTTWQQLKRIESSICFSQWKEGLHEFVFPWKPYRSGADVFLLGNKRNPTYKQLKMRPGGVLDISLKYGQMLTIPPQFLNFYSVDTNGRELYKMAQRVQSQATWDFHMLAQAVEQHSQGAVQSKDIHRIRCSLGLSQIALERSAAEERPAMPTLADYEQ